MKGIVMTKRLIVVLISLMFVLNSVSAIAEDGGYIKINDYGEDVIALHQKLGELGYYNLRAESPWSAKSIAALKILQENLDWEITGVVESKDQLDEILGMENVVGKNLLLGTNQGITNYQILDKGFNAVMESPDGVSVKVTSTTRDDTGWLVLFFDDGKSRELLSEPTGAYYTLSFEAKSNVENAEIRIMHRQQNAAENQITFGTVKLGEADVWKRYETTSQINGIAAASQGLYFDMRYGNPAGTEIEIKNLKLEKGSKATEWCAAVED